MIEDYSYTDITVKDNTYTVLLKNTKKGRFAILKDAAWYEI